MRRLILPAIFLLSVLNTRAQILNLGDSLKAVYIIPTNKVINAKSKQQESASEAQKNSVAKENIIKVGKISTDNGLEISANVHIVKILSGSREFKWVDFTCSGWRGYYGVDESASLDLSDAENMIENLQVIYDSTANVSKGASQVKYSYYSPTKSIWFEATMDGTDARPKWKYVMSTLAINREDLSFLIIALKSAKKYL